MKVLSRLIGIASEIEEAITDEVFDSWDSKKQKQWIKDHPTSKYASKDYKKKSGKKPAKRKNNMLRDLMGYSYRNKEKINLKHEKDDEVRALLKNDPSEFEDDDNAKALLKQVKKDNVNPNVTKYLSNNWVDLYEFLDDGGDKLLKSCNDKKCLKSIKDALLQQRQKGTRDWRMNSYSFLDQIKIIDKKLGISKPSHKGLTKLQEQGIDTDSKEYKTALKKIDFDTDAIEDALYDSGNDGLRFKDVSTKVKDGVLNINWVSQSDGDVDELVKALKRSVKNKSKNSLPVAVRLNWSTRDNWDDTDSYDFVLDPYEEPAKGKGHSAKFRRHGIRPAKGKGHSAKFRRHGIKPGKTLF